MEKKALFITFEGGEGSGKSTQVAYFKNWFEGNYSKEVMQTREPGGNDISEQIREIILDSKNTSMNDITELLLYEASRAQFIKEVVAPNLEKGVSVISDRFYDSTTAYQGFARGLSVEEINRLNNLVCNLNETSYHPDLTFIIDTPEEIGLKNAYDRGKLNRLDRESRMFHQKVRDGFLDIARKNCDRCILIPYQDGINKVHEDIVSKFISRYKG